MVKLTGPERKSDPTRVPYFTVPEIRDLSHPCEGMRKPAAAGPSGLLGWAVEQVLGHGSSGFAATRPHEAAES